MRLTDRGWGLLVAGPASLAAGLGLGYPELAALGCACLVAVLGAVGFVSWRPRLVVARTVDPDRVMRGEPSLVTLRISNASRLFGASLVAQDRCRPATAVPVPLLRLRPGRVATATYPVPTQRRGVIDVGPLEVSRRDPLGLAGAVRRYGQPVRMWVWPRIHPVTTVPVGLSRNMDGQVDRVPYGSITFATLREYVVGDDLRHIHWRTSARVGELMVREHVDTSLPRVVVLLDDRSRAHAQDGRGESTFEAACEAAASVVVAAVREQIAVSVVLVSGSAAAAGPADPAPPLDVLAEAVLVGGSAAAPDRLREAVRRLRVIRGGDTLLYLAGPADQDDLGLLAGLRGRYSSIIAALFGQAGGRVPAAGGVTVIRARDGADFAAAWNGVAAW